MRANVLTVCMATVLLLVSATHDVSWAVGAGGVHMAGAGERETVRIMPCGDSITYDNHSGDTRPAGLRIGYRQPLWHMLKDAGFDIDFVGSVVAGQDATPAFDPDSEGRPGWRDDEIADNIYNWLVATPADIILLHIGTNGLNTSAADVEDILDEVDRYETDDGVTVTVLLARIINRGNYICPNSSTTTTFNDNVEAMALTRISGGDSIVLVDLECGAGMDYREMPDGDMYDSLHPTDNGYWKMAGGWFAHLKDILTPIDAPVGMTHYWKLEDAGGPPYVNAVDAGAAACSECPTYTYDGRVWGCLEFDGDDDEVQIPDDGSFDWGIDDSFTIEFWMKKDTACDGGSVIDNEVIVGRDDPGTELHWWVGVNCGQTPGGVACFSLQDTGHGGQSISGSTVLTDGEWHHVVAVRNASADSTLLYIDGTREASAGHDYADGFDGVTPLDIGFMSLDGRFHYEGLVDEIALYDRALSESEILAHHIGGLDGKGYAQSSDGFPRFTSDPVTEVRVGEVYAYDAEAVGAPAPSFSLGAYPAGMQIEGASGLVTWLPGAANLGSHPIEVIATNAVGADTQNFVLDVLEEVACPVDMSHYWPLDDGSGSTPNDYYSTLDATLHGSPSWTTGVVGDAVEFDGTSQYMTVPDDASIDWGADSSFTVEVWARFTNCSVRNRVMVGRDNRPDGCHWWVGASEGSGVAGFYLRDDDDQGAACVGSTSMADGEWHHIVAVRDNAADMNRLYVDGVLEDAEHFDYGAGWGAGTTLGIGYMAYTGTPDYFYDGILDEIALYDRALSLSEIDEHYTNGLAGLGYCSLTETAPVITTSPVASAMVGILYSYDADAAGHPAPAFSLGACPATMQVNTATGLVTWTPQAGDEGPHLVELMAANSAGVDTQAYTITVSEAPECPPEMTAYWRLDEQTGPIYEDSFGLHNATSTNTPAAIVGLIGGAQQFDGYDDSISVPAHTDFDWGRDASFTIEYWMRKDTPCGGNAVSYNEVIVGRDDDGTGATDIHWWTGVSCWEMPQGAAVFQLRDENREGVHIRGTTFLLDGDWHHIVCVRDGAVDTNRIYVDGSLEGAIYYDYGAGFSSADGEPIEIGRQHDAFYYEGDADEIAIYGRALTVSEIQAHYTGGLAGQGYCQPGDVAPVITSTPPTGGAVGQSYSYDVDATGTPDPIYALAVFPTGMDIVEATGVITWTPSLGQEGLNDVEIVATNSVGADTQIFQIDVADASICPYQMVGYWTFDDDTGSPYEDSLGDNDATCSDCPSPTTGTVGGAVAFDGATDEVQIADNGSFDWGKDDSFTVEFWMRTDDSSPSQNRVIVGRDGGSTDLHWWIGYQTNGQARFQLQDVNANGKYVGGTGPVVNDDAWHLFACVRDDAAGMNRLFIDGALIDSAPHDYTAGFAESVPMNVGYLDTGGYYRYPGTVDELAIYDRALLQSEILGHYTDGLLGYGYCEEALVAPVITSTPPTEAIVGELYTYDVDATGDPAPTYALSVYPAGMTVVDTTGVVNWTPASGQEGLNPVDIIATNVAGSDTQSFTVNANAPFENVVCSPDTLYLALGAPGGTIDVNYLGGGSGLLYSYSVSFAWNDSVAVTSDLQVTEGNLLSDEGSTFFHVRETRAGRELTVDCSLFGDLDGAAGPGTMFTIEFEPVGSGATEIDLTVLEVRDKDNNDLTGFVEEDGLVVIDDQAPDVRDVLIENLTLVHTDNYIKDTDAARITATIVDDEVITVDDVTADLTGLGGGAAVHPDVLIDTIATWDLPSVTCGAPDGSRTVTVEVTDLSGRSDSDSDDIIVDNTPPGAVTGFDAVPGHEVCELGWVNGADDNLLGVVVRRATVEDDYPYYAAFTAAWPQNEAEALYPASAADGEGIYEGVLATSHVDSRVERGIYCYQAFCYDIVMQYGPAAETARDLAVNYLLGDVTDGTDGYDGAVEFEDLMVFSISYGASDPSGVAAECDFGPAVHGDTDGIGVPTPDGVVEFEDLMVFAMNYGAVYGGDSDGGPCGVDVSDVSIPAGPGEDSHLSLSLTRRESANPEVVELTLCLSGNDAEVKGLSTRFEYDAQELAFVSAHLSDRMESQILEVFMWGRASEAGAVLDLAVLGAGTVVSGSGELAIVEFRVLEPDFAADIASADLRNADNERLEAHLEGYDTATDIPSEFRILQNAPNPFNPNTTIAYHVPCAGDVSLRIYDVTGRLVTTLFEGHTEPGRHAVVWNGRGAKGEEVASGVYFCAMNAEGFSDSRKMLLLK